MTADLKKLSDSLRRDTPEKALGRAIERRRSELEADLRRGKTFEIRDQSGKVVKISPPRH
jgi:hypothetical protein